jgi:hypothetical protein
MYNLGETTPPPPQSKGLSLAGQASTLYFIKDPFCRQKMYALSIPLDK